jgi:hypothetical protein
MRAYLAADRALTATEEVLYRGLGWASRDRVLDRLEARSALTTACQEVAALRNDLVEAAQSVQRARSQFTLARALCLGENQNRAEGNLAALSDTEAAIAVQQAYLSDLSDRC